MSLVVDSSMALAWYFDDERSDESTTVLRRLAGESAVVPAIWPLEVANGLQMAVRRGRITGEYRDASLNDLRSLPIEIDSETNDRAWTATLALAVRLRLTMYDAAYLELALRRRLPLATFDQELVRAARSERVELIQTTNSA